MINYEFALKHQLENLSHDYSQEKLNILYNRALNDIAINKRSLELGGYASCTVSDPFEKWFSLYRSIGYTLKHIKKLNLVGLSEVVWRGHMSTEIENKYKSLDDVQLSETEIGYQDKYFEVITGMTIEYITSNKKLFDDKYKRTI
jgi:hypothetical protein